MARLGAFDINAVPGEAWFDDTTYAVGWYCDELVPPPPFEESGNGAASPVEPPPPILFVVGEEIVATAAHAIEEISTFPIFPPEIVLAPFLVHEEKISSTTAELEELSSPAWTGPISHLDSSP